ncbi:MAG: GspH/FimT family pseudopilin [Gammaproteobacteria bacterium]|nr:GspH/FimT family pseudopilin [Gammaproteobacteria bacterium]
MQGREQSGYTLIELLIVVATLSLIAAIAVPATSSNSEKPLDLAAQEFATAMRFARSEAIRSGQPHGFRQQSTEKRIRVFRLDQTTTPATLIYDAYHPIDKRPYDISITTETLYFADSLSRTASYNGTCVSSENVYFDANGSPWCSNPDSVLLDQFELQLTLGENRRRIALDRVTGRVTVQ